MLPVDIAKFAIQFCKVILSNCLQWFVMVYDALGLKSLWIGAVVLAAVFSIVIVPLRGGADLTGGALGSFLVNKTNRHKPHDD